VKENGVINELLKKYDLVLPVLRSEQRRILRSKKRALAAILCLDKKPSFIAGMAVRFFYMMRNAGLDVAPAAGLRAAVAVCAMVIMITAGGSLLFVQHYIQKPGMVAGKTAGVRGVIAAFNDGIVIKRNNTDLTNLKPKDRILEGDEIVTGDSALLLQFDNGVVVKVLKKSVVVVAKTGSLFELKSGGMLSRVPAAAAVQGYILQSPVTIVTVKGTEFGVFHESGKTKVAVTKGTVIVKHIQTGSEYEVPEGNETEVNADGKVKPLAEANVSVMKGFADMNYIESIESKSEAELKELGEKLKASDETKLPGKMTLAELKQKYGRLDEIMLYNGKKYTGVIVSRGGIYKILTPSGTVSVPAGNVKGSRVIQKGENRNEKVFYDVIMHVTRKHPCIM
jgi:hypothetical protein